jgi:predicted Rossmann fold flavoprotein
MMCAATLLENMPSTEPLSVALFDKNTKLGVKVLISGGGRCNVTTGITDKKTLLSKYIRGSDFLKPTLSSFPPQKVKARFENHGVPLKIEDDLRVFPVSDNGKDIVGIFEKLFLSQSNFLENYLGHGITSVQKNEKIFTLTLDDGTTQTADILVIATGGNAYAKTGSSGDGYEFARQLGHSITALGPSLNSFLSAQERPKKLSGLSLSSAKLETTLSSGEKKSVI